MTTHALLAVLLAAAAPAAADPYAAALADFEAYRAGKPVSHEGSRPYVLTHGRRADRSVLMIHGLRETPRQLEALARVFHQAGFNVVTVLLPGHGTRPRDLLGVRYGLWQADVDRGLSIARGLGREASVFGFSAGGALAVDAFRRRGPSDRFGGLYLFAPALASAQAAAEPLCLARADDVVDWTPGRDEKPGDPHRYHRMAFRAGCEVVRLARVLEAAQGEIAAGLAAGGTPVFVVQADDDADVSAAATLRFVAGLPASVPRELVVHPKGSGVKHRVVDADRPGFAGVVNRLKAFLGRDPNSRRPVALDALRERLAL